MKFIRYSIGTHAKLYVQAYLSGDGSLTSGPIPVRLLHRHDLVASSEFTQGATISKVSLFTATSTLRVASHSKNDQARTIGDDPGTTAIVYCEANFGKMDGKTANGLVRYSEKYEIP